MANKIETARLQDGLLVRHRIQGYQGRIDGITQIKACFTKGGVALTAASPREIFQYRIVVDGELMRHIAPADDLEILQEEKSVDIICFGCHSAFRSKPGIVNKVGGRCECGGWICPACLACKAANAEGPACMKQRERLVKKHARRIQSKKLRAEV
jgi:hypothetical protein